MRGNPSTSTNTTANQPPPPPTSPPPALPGLSTSLSPPSPQPPPSLSYFNPDLTRFLSTWRLHAGPEGATSDYKGIDIELAVAGCTITTLSPIKPHLGLFYCEFIAAPLAAPTGSTGSTATATTTTTVTQAQDIGISLGLSKSSGGATKPGWTRDSVGFFSSDGCLYMNSVARPYHGPYGCGDTVGLLLSFIDRTVSFTLNGSLLSAVDFLVFGPLRVQLSCKTPCTVSVVPQDKLLFNISQHFSTLVSRFSGVLRPPVYSRGPKGLWPLSCSGVLPLDLCRTQYQQLCQCPSGSVHECGAGCTTVGREGFPGVGEPGEMDVAGFFVDNWERRRRKDISPDISHNDASLVLAYEMLHCSTNHPSDWRENVLDCVGHGDVRSAIKVILDHGGTAPAKSNDRLTNIRFPCSFPLAFMQPLLDPVRVLVFGLNGVGGGVDGGCDGLSKVPLDMQHRTRLTTSSPCLARLFLEAALMLSDSKRMELPEGPCDPDPTQVGLLKLEALGQLCEALDFEVSAP